ncbi:phospholipid-transporting ATPase ABCA3-like [Arctopsyche grandis]|uniref:phospholipid-transporting ATPase ABCA3-like n=1 Tax=Arctopsyche grandis TaxID=121162 RepID=UPI00406D9810
MAGFALSHPLSLLPSRASPWDKFKLLIWKNFVLQKRHKLQTVIEILAPVIFVTLLVLVRSLVEPDTAKEVRFDRFDPSHFISPKLPGLPSNITNNNISNIPNRISYSPESSVIRKIVEDAVCYLASENNETLPCFKILLGVRINAYPNALTLEQKLIDPSMNDSNFCGIQFDDDLAGMTFENWPDHINIALRFPAQLRTIFPPNPFLNWRTNFLYSVIQAPGPRSRNESTGGWPGYVQEGFIQIAHGIIREITNKLNKNNALAVPDLFMQRYPHPGFLKDDLLPALQGFISIIIMLSFNYTCINTVRVIAIEKEMQLKEVMKIMGLSNWLHWMAWFVKAFSYLIGSIILIVILLKVEWYKTEKGLTGYSVFTFTPWHVILVFMIIFIITSICYCFMISTFFSKANTAATVAGLVWFLSYAPYMFLANDKVIPSLATRLLACLASNTAMAYGFEIILLNEGTGGGLQWSNFFKPLTTDDSFVMAHVILMLIVDAILYLLIALYVEQIFPGSYGVPQPWYFPVTCQFWTGICGSSAAVMDTPHNDFTEIGDTVEPDPKGLGVGINIINLTKIYDKKIAVDKLNLKIFEDQITVLLGHNGAGKTTTMSMLTGISPPTSGTAIVAGHDIRKDIGGVRGSLGLCPQHNVLFSDLTVAEHIYFYARLKGCAGKTLDEEVEKYVKLLGLEDKKNVNSSSLSGGMQRRLSVGAALCGGSRVVLLDEPSSGMDPSARRELWDLLHLEKKGRTMILTTHFMDEAEILGERVAILSGGKLRCVGSPFYLKKKLGIGYRLTAARKTSLDGSYNAPAGPVTNLLKTHIPVIKLYTDIGSELSYILPEDQSGNFEPMLIDLENRQVELGLVSFGISATTLEEVFMRVGSDTVDTFDIDDSVKEDDINGFIQHEVDSENIEKQELPDCAPVAHTGMDLILNQWIAIFFKKILVTGYTWILGILQLVIPVLFLIIAIVVSRMWGNPTQLPARNLELANGYEDSVTYLNTISESTESLAIETHYKNYFDEYDIESMKLVEVEKDMQDYYLETADVDMPSMRRRNLIGATIDTKRVIAWFSNFAFHDLPASFILAHNAILKSVSPKSSISLVNYPLPFTLESKFELLQYGDGGGFQIAFNIGFSMAFVSSFFVLFYIKENVSRSKLLQLASGASPFILWTVAFLWDMLCFVVISIFSCITLLAFEQEGFSTGDELGRVFLLLILFGWAMLPLHYLASSFFLSPSTGFSRMCLFNVFTGVAMFLVVEVMNAPGLDLKYIGTILHYVFLLFPHYTLCSAMKYLSLASLTLTNCLRFCDIAGDDCDQSSLCYISEFCCLSDNPYFDIKRPGVGVHLIYLIFVGIVLFLVLLLKEYRIHNMMCGPGHIPPSPIMPDEEDSDVASERKRVLSLSPADYQKYNLITENMTRYYNNFLAVNQLTLGIKEGECFGLLGINGAGKTTTFKMLTGDLQISSGGAWVRGVSINNDMKTVYKKIGYCPQFDALLDEMTGRQTLKMYSLLRGIPSNRRDRFILDLSDKLGFTKHLDKKVQAYSGGNKRKLSTSIALLGNPQVVYLDEPTTGMDPGAKRLVWNAISECPCVVLTSHSMEECEALCSRLAIMVNGKPQCLGSPQHLKNKFSQGYTLIVKLQRVNLLPIEQNFQLNSSFDFIPLNQFLISKFPDAKMIESYQGLITYYLPDINVRWSTIFGVMEAAKEELNIEDYSIGQTSLEQIFLQFTNDQRVHV